MARELSSPFFMTFLVANGFLFIILSLNLGWAVADSSNGCSCPAKYEQNCTRLYDQIQDKNEIGNGKVSSTICAFIQCLHNAYRDGCQCNFHLKQFNSIYLNYRSRCISNSTTAVPIFSTNHPSTITPTEDSKCHGSYSNKLYKTCSIFGSWHLRTFEGGLESCTSSVSPAQSGSWPVIKNKHFTIQGSFHTVKHDTAALRMNKVSLVINEDDCTTPRTYKASIDNIPNVFTNGSPKGKGIRIEIIKEKVKMKIVIERINTSIIVHQTGPFLAVTTTVPSVIEYAVTSDLDLPVICDHGCPTVYGDDQNNKLSTGNWSLVNGSSAYNNCSSSNFTNYYLYTCMVDLITSNNLAAPQWTTDAMEDFYKINGGPTTNETATQFFTTPSTDNSALGLSKSSLVALLILMLYQLLIM